MVSRPSAWALAALLLPASVLSSEPPPAGEAPGLTFISASINHGSGQPLPPGARRPRPELWGLVRITGIKIRQEDFSLQARLPETGRPASAPLKLRLGSLVVADPAEPAVYRWTAVWPREGPPEGWTVTVACGRGRTRRSATGPIQVHLLPVARPREGQQRPN